MPRPTKSPNGHVLRGHFSYPPELKEKIKRLADKGLLSEACREGIKNYEEKQTM